MKDKLKGLLLGLLIGTMLSGSLAYAANSKKIEVYFKQIKFMFDGAEKSVGDKSALVYEGKVYVPIRDAAKAFGEPIAYDGKNGTIWIGDKGVVSDKPSPVVAVYKGGKVTQAEYEKFLSFTSFYFGQPDSQDMTATVKQMIALRTLAAKAEAKHAADTAKDTDAAIEQILQYFGSQDKMKEQLAQLKLTEAELRQFIQQNSLAGKALEDSIDDKAIQAEYDKQRQADSAAFVNANIRHILVATADGETGAALRTEEEALARANEARAKLVAGGDFAEVAKAYSDDPGSKDAGGLYENAELNQFVEPFKKAGAEQAIGEIGQPVKTDFGYHVIKVDSRTVKTAAEVKDQLMQGLMGQAYQKYLSEVVIGLIESLNVPAAK